MEYQYLEAETTIVFNQNDPDLSPIEYFIGEPPPVEEMLNYMLPPEECKWKRFDMPQKLQILDRDLTMTPRQKVEQLEQNQEYYKAELEYIYRDIKFGEEGFWIILDKRPYYIPPYYYLYLQWWPIDGKYVQFRNRDRKFFLFDRMVDNDPDAIGFNYPKHRREGATNKITSKRKNLAQKTPFAKVGMQSKDEKHAKKIHEEMVDMNWRYYTPFWRKPIYNGLHNDTSSLSFSSPTAKSHPDYGSVSLNSLIDFRDSGEKAYDGLKLKHLFNDEIGKTVEVDVKRRMEIQRQCLAEGSTIFGKMVNASTVDEMEKGGGKVFKKICDQSHFHKKNKKTGRTTSWLYNFFMPAGEGFGGEIPEPLREQFGCENWIDDYGFDVMDPETGRPAAEIFHLAVRDEYRRTNDFEGLIEYTRQFPLSWKDCWKQSVNECNFNLEIIEDRLDYYRNGNDDKQRGDFMWLDGVKDGTVIWVNNPTGGKFYISYQFPDPRDSNKYFINNGVRIPANTRKFCAGGDPFKFKTTKMGKKSMGGGAVFMKHDIFLDPPGLDTSKWRSNRFVCTYSHRPQDKRIYGEDMIMMCVYFGCEMYPEINVEFLWDYFMERGYGGYLMYAIDPNTNKVSITPGANTSDKTKEAIFREYQFYIQHHGLREVHDEILEQCKDIEDDMGDYDLFVAGGLALIGAGKQSFVTQEQTTTDIDELIPTYYHR
jgi:hypothetical protein